MSPEQITKPHLVGGRSDLYSAGVVLYEMVPANCPFDAESDFLISAQPSSGTAAFTRSINPGVPAALEAVILRAVGKRSAEPLIQTCNEMAMAIAGATGHQATFARWSRAVPWTPNSGTPPLEFVPPPPPPPSFRDKERTNEEGPNRRKLSSLCAFWTTYCSGDCDPPCPNNRRRFQAPKYEFLPRRNPCFSICV